MTKKEVQTTINTIGEYITNLPIKNIRDIWCYGFQPKKEVSELGAEQKSYEMDYNQPFTMTIKILFKYKTKKEIK